MSQDKGKDKDQDTVDHVYINNHITLDPKLVYLEWENIQANYSAMMYLITEQHAMIGLLLEELVRAKVLDDAQLTRVTGIYADADILNPIYNDIYGRFVDYFIRVREVIQSQTDSSLVPPTLEGEDPEKNDGGIDPLDEDPRTDDDLDNEDDE